MRRFKEKKQNKRTIARENIDFYFDLIENNFRPDYNKRYVAEILRLSRAFNVRLSRAEKLRFCKSCNTYFNISNRNIRLNSRNGAVEHICRECGEIRRIGYK